MSNTKRIIRVGSRKSQLALIQTNSVISQLQVHHPEVEFELISMTTTGDKILDTALSKIGEKSLFTRELETALLDRQVDFVVHSLKDLPTELPEGLVIGAICSRDDPHDALVLEKDSHYNDINSLPPGSVIGTSSLRRAAQLKRNFPQISIADVRGNLKTRLKKLDDVSNGFAGIVLAVAGLQRMQWDNRISQVLPNDLCMYAVGQGAMAVECRSDDEDILLMLSVLTDKTTLLRCIAERAFLRRLEGGCSVPVAVSTELESSKLTLRGGVFSIDGTEAFTDNLNVNLSQSEDPQPENQSVTWPSRHLVAVTAPSTVASSTDLEAAEALGFSLADRLVLAGAGQLLTTTKEMMAADIARQKEEKARQTTQAAVQQ